MSIFYKQKIREAIDQTDSLINKVENFDVDEVKTNFISEIAEVESDLRKAGIKLRFILKEVDSCT